jgi:hypothetical protein
MSARRSKSSCGSESKGVATAHLSALVNATVLARAHYRRLELLGLDVVGTKGMVDIWARLGLEDEC